MLSTTVQATASYTHVQTTQSSSDVVSSTDPRPLKDVSNEKLAQLLLGNYRAFQQGNAISTHLISNAADSRSFLNGAYTKTQKNIATELKARPELLDVLSLGRAHRLMDTREAKFVDRIALSDLALEANRADLMSDNSLIRHTYLYFNEYAAGGSADRYVNFNELKEAAGQVPTNRTFSAQASSVAAELLKRTSLLDKLDVGVGLWGFSGSRDERFDKQNLEYMNNKASRRAHFP